MSFSAASRFAFSSGFALRLRFGLPLRFRVRLALRLRFGFALGGELLPRLLVGRLARLGFLAAALGLAARFLLAPRGFLARLALLLEHDVGLLDRRRRLGRARHRRPGRRLGRGLRDRFRLRFDRHGGSPDLGGHRGGLLRLPANADDQHQQQQAVHRQREPERASAPLRLRRLAHRAGAARARHCRGRAGRWIHGHQGAHVQLAGLTISATRPTFSLCSSLITSMIAS
ncbi:MAG: hypothetical protein M5U30_15850 [Burkholderiaceae bacterium]|nr:hypothetical protein [Burkholderiaceae bacterium]